MTLADSNPERAATRVREAITIGQTRGPNAGLGTYAIAGEVLANHGPRRERPELLRIVLAHWQESGIGGPTLYQILGHVTDLVAAEVPVAAAIILGAVETVQVGLQLVGYQIDERADALATLNAVLGDDRFAELRNEGADMSEADVIACTVRAIDSCLAS